MSTPTLPRHIAFATPRSKAYAASSNVLPAHHAAPATGARGPGRRALRVRVVVVTLLVALVALVVVHVLQANVSGSTVAAEPVRASVVAAAVPTWVVTPSDISVPAMATPFGQRQPVTRHHVKVGWTTQFHLAATDETTLLGGAAPALTSAGWQVRVGRHDVFAVRIASQRAEMVKATTNCTGGRTTCTLTVLYAARPTA